MKLVRMSRKDSRDVVVNADAIAYIEEAAEEGVCIIYMGFTVGEKNMRARVNVEGSLSDVTDRLNGVDGR